jgi:hypothetical protein
LFDFLSIFGDIFGDIRFDDCLDFCSLSSSTSNERLLILLAPPAVSRRVARRVCSGSLVPIRPKSRTRSCARVDARATGGGCCQGAHTPLAAHRSCQAISHGPQQHTMTSMRGAAWRSQAAFTLYDPPRICLLNSWLAVAAALRIACSIALRWLGFRAGPTP